MKRVITIIALLSCLAYVTTSAQTLHVQSFTKSATDLTARTNKKEDINGQGCALLKVRLAIDNAKFDGMVAHVEHKLSEYWVYLSPGARKINISLSGFLPLEVVFDDYNCPKLESLVTYILTVEAPSVGGQSNQLQRVVFNITPVDADAKLYIDNLNYTVSNGKVEVPLGVGSHTYRIESKYYKIESGSLVLDGSTETRTVDVKLRQHFGRVEIASNPAGADVKLNGKILGLTPCKLPLIAGRHTIQLVKKGYATKELDLEIVDDKAVQIDETLSSLIDARISTKPVNAHVSVDGENIGNAPCNIQKPAGKYQINLTSKGYYDKRSTITIDGSKTAYNFNMKKIYFRSNGGYIEGNIQVGSFMSYGGSFGLYFSNVNIEASYYAGMSKSDEIFWNTSTTANAQMPTSYTYQPSLIGGKIGYGILLANMLRFTPQVGFNVISLKGTMNNHGESTGVEKTYVSTASVGARFHLAIASNVGVSIAPEYSFGVAKGKAFDTMAEASSKIKNLEGGFNCRIGLNVFF